MQQPILQDHNANPPADVLTVKRAIFKVKSLNRYLFSKWKLVLLFGIIGAAIGFLYATLKKINYTAQSTFVLDEGNQSGGGSGQYSALASMVGIDVGGGGTGLFQGDNIIELYKSRLMLEKTLLTSVAFDGKKQLLIDRYIQINNLRKGWDNNAKLKDINFDLPKSKFKLQHDSIISLVVNDLNKNYLTVSKPDKKLSIVSVKTVSKDELFAKAFTEAIVSNVNSFYIQTKTKVSLQNLKLLQRQADSIHVVLNSSLGATASAMDADPNPNPSMQIIRVPTQRRQIDVQSNVAIYAEVVKNLEIARGILQRQTPLIQLIDEPVLPLANDRLGRFKTMVTGAIISMVLGLCIIIVRKIYINIIAD